MDAGEILGAFDQLAVNIERGSYAYKYDTYALQLCLGRRRHSPSYGCDLERAQARTARCRNLLNPREGRI